MHQTNPSGVTKMSLKLLRLASTPSAGRGGDGIGLAVHGDIVGGVGVADVHLADTAIQEIAAGVAFHCPGRPG